nr:MFS transporter [Bifidobacterium miconisargentati]
MGTLLAVLNMSVVTPALPSIMKDLGVDSTTVQWLSSGYSLVEAMVIPLAAFLMGRFSTRRLFIGCISLFAAGSLVAAFAPTFPLLMVGRVLQALCTGAIMPMVTAVILLVFPKESRGTAMGITGLVVGFARRSARPSPA